MVLNKFLKYICISLIKQQQKLNQIHKNFLHQIFSKYHTYL